MLQCCVVSSSSWQKVWELYKSSNLLILNEHSPYQNLHHCAGASGEVVSDVYK